MMVWILVLLMLLGIKEIPLEVFNLLNLQMNNCRETEGIRIGYIHSDGKFQASLGHKLFGGTNLLLKTFPLYHPRTVSIKCKQSNIHRRNPDFSRRQKGSSRGKNHHYQENPDETDPLPSKNGSLLSLSSNQRYSATSTPGRREKEIVDLFRKVQAQLRERTAIKEEKKIEASQQRQQGNRGTVDSLLKLLRKHSMAHSNKKSGHEEEFNLDESNKSTPEEEFNIDEPEKSDSFEEEPNSNFFTTSNITASNEVTFRRPASNFRRRSPVPRGKFQPVFSSSSLRSKGWEKGIDNEPEQEHATFEEFEEHDEESSDERSYSNESDQTTEEKEVLGASATKVSDLASLKLLELKDLAKSRGLKGYSKLKKGVLVELLSGDCS